jgi:hypothetical protein
MKYKIRKLDGRYSYREYFKYCLIFYPRMSPEHKGILWFNDVKLWFKNTYGYSAEIKDWHAMLKYHHKFGSFVEGSELAKHVNFNWSWTNGYEDLRIYVKGDKELGFFKLANPVDPKG